MTTVASQAIVRYLRQHGRTPAAELRSALKLSPPTLGRALTAESAMIRVGKARASQYALTRPLRGQSQWPLYRLDSDARVVHLGTLISLEQGEFALRSERPLPLLLHTPFELGVYPDVPWFLEDSRPQGFLGRSFAHSRGAELGLPQDLRSWNAEHIIVALLSGGSTGTGDLIVGELSLQRALLELEAPPDLIASAERLRRYPQLAAQVMAGEPPGSSPGGEQPKFSATIDHGSGRTAVIVKFSPKDSAAGARRWASLLRCEALAAAELAQRGIPAAATELVESPDQIFLQSQRFDRTNQLGRRGFASLASIHSAFYGDSDFHWWQIARRLRDDGWLDAENAQRLRRLSWFGTLIANTDMHLGNAGLILGDHLPAALAPVYDMLPMLLRPDSQGLLIRRAFAPQPPAAGQVEDWLWAATAAVSFWRRVHSDQRIEADVRAFASQAEGAIEQLRRRFE